jgi:hypothetical protein
MQTFGTANKNTFIYIFIYGCRRDTNMTNCFQSRTRICVKYCLHKMVNNNIIMFVHITYYECDVPKFKVGKNALRTKIEMRSQSIKRTVSRDGFGF